MGKKDDLTGKTFGNLFVIEKDNSFLIKKGMQIKYICRCSCYNKTILSIKSHDLRSGKKDNCGCLTKIKQSLAKKKFNQYDLSGEFGIGYTFKGKEFYFDLEDYDKIKNYCWSLHKSRNTSYVEARDIRFVNKIIKMHRLLTNTEDSNIKIDHKNRDGTDNRKSNLRQTDSVGNARNRGERYDNQTGYNGVSLRKDSGKYRVRIRHDGKEINIGTYEILENAINARKCAESKFYGEYCRTR